MESSFTVLIQKLAVALEQNGWKGRFVIGSVTVQPPVLTCPFQLHPLDHAQRAWAQSAGVFVQDWKAIQLSLRYTDGQCMLEMPRQVYHFSCMTEAAERIFANACMAHVDAEETISQEAVDMFIESVMHNAGSMEPADLMQALCSKIQRSDVWHSEKTATNGVSGMSTVRYRC